MIQIESTIVIRCCNEERHIGRLLAGVFQQTSRNFDVVLVDSGSTDGTLAIAKRFPVRIATIGNAEFSFGRSLNIGCRVAEGEFIVLASAHVYPLYDNWLEQLLAPFFDERVALVYGKQQGDGRTKFSEHQIFSKWFPEESDADQAHPFCNNANAAIRRSVWEQLPYDETLTGLEDLDWAKRAMALGYKVAYAAEAPIVHVHEETAARIYNRYRREAIALKRIMPQERFSPVDFGRLLTSNVFHDWYHAWRDGVLLRNIGSILLFRLMQFWGTYRGFQQRGPITSELKRRFYYPKGLNQAQEKDTDTGTVGRAIDYQGVATGKMLGERA